jgi:hypothetical protein
MTNLSFYQIPGFGLLYDPGITGPILARLASIVNILWGPRTLARYRFA